MSLAPEVDLLLRCCRWPVDTAAIAGRAARPIDLDRFVGLVRRHRVQGLVHHALQVSGAAEWSMAVDRLRGEARAIAIDNVRLAFESNCLVERFGQAGVRSLVLKGVTVAKLAYGSLSYKVGWDIDLLIDRAKLAVASGALAEAGYQRVLPPPEADLAAWHASSKESIWRHHQSGAHVELHTALVDHPRLLPGLGMGTATQHVDVGGGVTLPTLNRDDLLAYLCAHGAASGWRRVKWLADLAALLAQLGPAAISDWYDSATARNAGRAPAQGLLLCERYLGLPLNPTLSRRLRSDPVTRLVTAIAGRLMTRLDGFDAPEETAFGTLPIHLSYALIMPGPLAVFAEVRRKLQERDPAGGRGMSRQLAARLGRLVTDPAGPAPTPSSGNHR